MPHSPRWHGGRLWLLNSGAGEFGHVDPGSGRFEPLAFCPGFARGLALCGDHAIVGLSRPREPTSRGLPLEEALAARGAAPRCGLVVIDLRDGVATHWVRIEGPVSELFSVVVLPGVARPNLLGFVTDEIRHDLWLREGVEVRHRRVASAADHQTGDHSEDRPESSPLLRGLDGGPSHSA
jgi:uncharacterized protein (TIGR03032 family)